LAHAADAEDVDRVNDLGPTSPPAQELEPLPTLLPPEGVIAVRLRDVVARARSLETGRLDVSGVRGCAGAAIAAGSARAGRRVVLVTEDQDGRPFRPERNRKRLASPPRRVM
jgi:hypothetical protein